MGQIAIVRRVCGRVGVPKLAAYKYSDYNSRVLYPCKASSTYHVFYSAEDLDINFQPRNKILFKTYGIGTIILTCQYENGRKRPREAMKKEQDLVCFLSNFYE